MNRLKTLVLPFRLGLSSACVLTALGVALLTVLPARAGVDSASAVSDPSIQALIDRLGAREYAQREKARVELQQMGVAAFEALHAAQYHADVEIRKQAEYLLRAIRIVWTQEDDPEEVKQLLRRYQQDEYDDRLERLRQLGQIQGGKALPALCRLVRFETSEVLSKRAALAVMNYAVGPQQVDPEFIAEEIRAVIGGSRRTAVNWLRAYASTLQNPEGSLDDWRRLTAQEVEAVRRYPDKDRMAVVQDLLRWQIEWLQRLGRQEEMLAVLQQLLPLQGNSITAFTR